MRFTRSFLLLAAILLFATTRSLGQFANTYIHGVSDDHTSVVRSINSTHYVQASTALSTTKDIHLMMFDAAGNVVLDKVFFSGAGDEVALDICRGNNNSYIVCGYESIGGLDLGFVMSVDTNFNLLGKVNIQVPANNRHTPALNIINSAFYMSPPNFNTFFPPDPNGGYLVTGFEAAGYGPTAAKSGYALKISNTLSFQWMVSFDSPVPLGGPDWDMCSAGSYNWISPGYFLAGSGTSPTGEQVALAAEIDNGGNVLWAKRYHDSNVPGSSSVAVDVAFDDSPLEMYQITNHSSSQGAGFVTFAQGTGVIDPFLSRRFLTNSPGYYAYEFGATCASTHLLISGYGHNQTSGSITGLFPYTFRYEKGINPGSPPAVDMTTSKYAYPVQSSGYNPAATIFDTYQTGTHPRIYHPKLFAQLAMNDRTLAAFEDVGPEEENYLVHPFMNGEDSCAYIDPGFTAVPITLSEWPMNSQLDTVVLTPGVYSDSPETHVLQQCCDVDVNFIAAQGANCQWTFTASNPGNCALFTIWDIANNVLFSGPGGVAAFIFPTSGTYTVCFSDCGGVPGATCREEQCQTIQVTCPPPCPLDADFNFTVNGCCVNFTDLTPDGNPDGCEYWVFGNIQTVMAGDITSFCFPGSGTYTVCHVDCCVDVNGITTYHQVCKQVTVNCTPPCCLPTGITVNASNCCITASPNLPGGCSGPLYYFWSFGDGNVSTQANPTHCFAGSGKYTICLTAYCGKMQKVKFCKTVKVLCALPPPPPGGGWSGTARFSYNASGTSIGLAPAPVPTGLSISSRTWSFGDGSTSSTEAPSHYYPLSGTYLVTQTVQGTVLADGTAFTDEHILPITLVLAPACGCAPPSTGAFAGNPVACEQSNSVLLRLIDFDTESDIEHQWMVSTCGSPDCPTDQFVPMPGAIGQHVWIEDVATTSWYRCRSTSELGFVQWSEEVEVEMGYLEIAASGPSAVCPGAAAVLTATGAEFYEWSTGQTGGSIVVAPTAMTTYTVDGTNEAGCLASDEVIVDVGGGACGIDLQVKAMLAGPFDADSGTMSDALRVAGLLPLTEPYSAAGYAWPPGSSGSTTTAVVLAASGLDAITDWVLVELRDAAHPSVVLETRSALMQRDGDVVGIDGISPVHFNAAHGDYHVAVRHRIHLAAATATPTACAAAPVVIDLSASGSAAFGTDATVLIGGKWCLWSGDVSGDGALQYVGEGNDRDPILSAIGGSVPTAELHVQYRAEDTNMDGTVRYVGEANDRDPILQNIGGSVPTAIRAVQLP